MNWIERMDNLLPSRKRKKTQNTCFGVEVEVEWDNPDNRRWVIDNFPDIANITVTEDGSLRNGLEFVSTVPHVKSNILKEVGYL